MVKRLLLPIVLSLSGLMLVISPVAARETSSHAPCRASMAVTTELAEAHDIHHGHSASSSQASEATHELADGPTCCDHGCLPDATAFSTQPKRFSKVSPVLSTSSDSANVDLTGPLGLRRPPESLIFASWRAPACRS